MISYLHPASTMIDVRTGERFEAGIVVKAAHGQAVRLRRLGVEPGARVVISHDRGPALIADLFAIWSLGATAVVVSHAVVERERVIIAERTQARAWIGLAGPADMPLIAPATFGEEIAGPDFPPRFILDDAALIMMTSGTTSEPKGVVLTHRALQARLALNVAHIGRDDLVRALTVLPMHFGHGLIGNTLTVLAAGGTLALWPEPGAAGLPRLGATIDRLGITFMSSVPSLWRAATRLSAPPSGGTLRRVHVGSAPLSAELWGRICDWTGTRRVINMYGITETANWIGGHSAETGVLEDGLVGEPWGGSIRLRLEDGSIVDRGRGEVAVNSPSLMSGYHGRPDLGAQSLVGDWFLTGDIGAIDALGRLRLIGRSKHEINRGGIKIPAEEIDALLERHPSVIEACAFSLPDPLSGETVAAAVVFAPDAATTVDGLKDWCIGEIRREALPSRLFVLPVLPRTDRGKLNRDVVRAACVGDPAGAPA